MELFDQIITDERWEELCTMRPILVEGDLFDSIVRIDGRRLDIRQSHQVRNHSLDFAWGYGGSGPAQLALAILLDVTGSSAIAERLHQDLKWEIVSHWNRDSELIAEVIDIGAWLRKKESAIMDLVCEAVHGK